MTLPNRGRLPETPPLSPLEQSDRRGLVARERWMGGWCGVREEGVDKRQALRSDHWAILSRQGERCLGWFLGLSGAGHSSCRRKGLYPWQVLAAGLNRPADPAVAHGHRPRSTGQQDAAEPSAAGGDEVAQPVTEGTLETQRVIPLRHHLSIADADAGPVPPQVPAATARPVPAHR